MGRVKPGQEDHIGMPARTSAIIHPKRRAWCECVTRKIRRLAALQHNIAQRSTARDRAFGVEVDIDDVFVLLGWILGEADRAVGAAAEPLGMLADPGMVGRTLDGEIERDFEAMLAGGCHQPAKVLRRAECCVDRVVTAVASADRVGTAGIVGRRLQGVVAALAIGRADRMDGRK